MDDCIPHFEPKDIGNEDIILAHRQQVIEKKLLMSYAKEVADNIAEIVSENCNGCIIEHCSQKQHPCLYLETDEKISLYFDDALDRVTEADVVKRFIDSIKELKPGVNGLELLKYTCDDWRKRFCFLQRKNLKRETFLLCVSK